MYGLHGEFGLKDIFFAVFLEVIFLSFCIIIIGLAISEIKKKKHLAKNAVLLSIGLCLIAISFYVTKLFVEG